MNKRITSFVMVSLLFLVVTSANVEFSVTLTWSADTRLTSDPNFDYAPAITQTMDGRIWVTWHSDRTGNEEIFYKILTGSTWSDDTRLTFDSHMDMNPSILQSSDGKIWIVWDSDRTGDFEIYCKTSSDNGASWSGDIQLTTEPARDSFPSIMQASDGKIWIFWTSGRDVTVSPPDPTFQPSANIFYKVSIDNGQTWSEDTLVVTDYKNNYRDDLYPSCMQAANGSIWVVWAKEAKDVYYKLYNGTAWSGEVRLTFDAKENTNPFIMQTTNGRIWVFWDSFRNAHDTDLYHKIFDGSWSNDIQLTTSLEEDQWPSAVQTEDLTIWVVWTSPRYPQLVYDIFYRTGLEVHDVAVSRITPNASHETFAFRGEAVYIEIEAVNQGEGNEVFEVKSYANSSFLGSRTISLDAGKSFVVVFTWNTTGARAGKYLLNAYAVPVLRETDTTDNTLTYSIFEVRMKGDICGWYGGVLKPIPDRRVNIDDFGMVVGHYATANQTSWHPVWGPACDINEDGKVDLDDVMIVGIHYLET